MEEIKVRQDAWSHEDDLMLAETVLRHIREGSTQLNAFEEVGDRLNRTAAACGFRWNAEIRKKYDQAVEIAKKQRKERQRLLANNAPTNVLDEDEVSKKREQVNETQSVSSSNSSLNLDTIITFLQDVREKSSGSEQLRNENERLKHENQALQAEKTTLEKKLNRMNEQKNTIQEDYQALIQIMDRARRMVFVDDAAMNAGETQQMAE